MKKTLYDYDTALMQARALLDRAQILDENRRDIVNFLNYMQARGLSKARIIRYHHVLRPFAKALDMPFRTATKEDIIAYVASLDACGYSEYTKVNIKVGVKRFYKWLLGDDEEYPRIVRWIKGNVPRDRIKEPQHADLVTEEDVSRLVERAHHPRDKAFHMTIWESGGRIGEIGTIDWKDVTFDKYGVVVQLTGKTGTRPVRLVQAAPYLASWKAHHPRGHDLNARVWVSTSNSNRGEPLGYQAMRKVLRVAFEEAGIKKKCNPHMFRHARSSFMAPQLTEAQMNEMFGWVQGSDMPRFYNHLSGKSNHATILRMNGIDVAEDRQVSPLRPRVCSRCSSINPATGAFCQKCGMVLTAGVAMTTDSKVRQSENLLAGLLDDPQVRDIVRAAITREAIRRMKDVPDQSGLRK